jgi:hypothetical protein
VKARRTTHAALCAEEAEEALKELRSALEKAGVGCPLVELGRCSLETARRLAAAPAAVAR